MATLQDARERTVGQTVSPLSTEHALFQQIPILVPGTIRCVLFSKHCRKPVLLYWNQAIRLGVSALSFAPVGVVAPASEFSSNGDVQLTDTCYVLFGVVRERDVGY